MKKAWLVLFAVATLMLSGGGAIAAAKGIADGDLPQGKWVIGLSNSYYGNTWRKQMVESFESVAKEAVSKGLIKGFEVMNGDGTVNAQIAQINTFIMKKVDAIVICAASLTALNSAIEKAHKAGIKVIAFDSIVSNPNAFTMDYDWAKFGKTSAGYVVDKLKGKGNVIIVRGVSGAAPDQGIYAGIMDTLKAAPDIKVVATVNGEASATKAQEELLRVLPSLPEVDAVITHGGGDAPGVVSAFEQAHKKMPIIIGDNSAEFINWWISQKGYETMSLGSTPGCGGAAFWTALNVLNGINVPKKMMLETFVVTKDNLKDYSNLKPGTIVSPVFTNEYVLEKLIKPARAR